MIELNTLLGLPKDFDTSTLSVGQQFTISKDRERAFPLHIAVLIVDSEWNFYGYAVVHSALVQDQKTQFTFEVLSVFEPSVRAIYKRNFVQAGKATGEIS